MMAGWIYTLLFIYCTLTIVYYVGKFFIKLFSNPPQQMMVGTKDLCVLGTCLSYIITYLIC